MKRLVLVALAFALLMGRSAIAVDSAQPNVIKASLVGLPNQTGRVACAIFNAPDGFPRDRVKATARVFAPIENLQGTCEFKDLPPGTYAVAAFHDMYETGKMKTNFLGIPQEVYGFSNDAKASGMTPPPFSACDFTYPGGTMSLTLHAQQ
jgi:uncharacterized protein (DUF2141 family)